MPHTFQKVEVMAEHYAQFSSFKLVPVSSSGTAPQSMQTFGHMTAVSQSGQASQYRLMVVNQGSSGLTNGSHFKNQALQQSGNSYTQQQYTEISASGQTEFQQYSNNTSSNSHSSAKIEDNGNFLLFFYAVLYFDGTV